MPPGSHHLDFFSLPAGEQEKAFEALYDRLEPGLYRYVYSKVRIKEVCEEIIQEIFLALWAKRDSLVINMSVEAWLFGAAKNKILTFIKSRTVRERYAANFVLYASERFDNSNEEILHLNDLFKTIEESISALPDHYQTAFRLSRMQHQPTQRIAEHMKISPRTVENYISAALKHLRISLDRVMLLIILSKMLFPWG
jgi:RNA polymerase sigma-70 factor (ECF subfamily)